MAVKTITITKDAYESLKRSKHGDESFSDVINRTYGQKMKVKDLFGLLTKTPKEHEEVMNRLKKIRNEMNKSMEERTNRVRSRYVNSI